MKPGASVTSRMLRLLAVAVGGAVAMTMTSCAPSPAPTSVAGAADSSAVVTPTAEPFDVSSITLPASSCDRAATGDITLVNGSGTVEVGPNVRYAVTAQQTDEGELAGRPAAVVRYSCLLEGANGVGEFPVAVFLRGDDGYQLEKILYNSDLGMTKEGSSLHHDGATFVDGQLVITGKYLTANDPRCCPSGQGWTSVAWVYGRLMPAGVITAGAPPATLPAVGAIVKGDLIVYSPPLDVGTEDDLQYLDPAPAAFRDFVWARKKAGDNDRCDAVISVSRMSLKGFASGGSACAEPGPGAGFLWYEDAGTWKVLMNLQDWPPCDRLRSVAFAPEALGSPSCYDAGGNVVPYTG